MVKYFLDKEEAFNFQYKVGDLIWYEYKNSIYGYKGFAVITEIIYENQLITKPQVYPFPLFRLKEKIKLIMRKDINDDYILQR